MTQHVLVTGSTGFVGRHLTTFLSGMPGVTVWGLSRHGGKIGDVRVAAVDLSEPGAAEAWSASGPQFTAVFHLAAAVPGPATADGASLLMSNVTGTASAVALASRHHAHLVYASSAYIYDPTGGAQLTEDSVPRPSTYYHLSKFVGEQLCDLARRRHGLQATSLRIAAVYGPGQTARTVLHTFVQAAKESADLVLHGSGDRTQDFIHVSDVVEAIRLAWQRQAVGTFHVATGHSVSMRGLAEIVRANVKGSCSAIRVSGSEDPQDDARWEFSTVEARRALGFEAVVSLSDGIRSLASVL